MKQLLFLLCFLCAAAGAGQVIGQGFTPGVGGSSVVDSTRLDTTGGVSVLKYWLDGVVVGEDTLAEGGVTATDVVTIAESEANADSIRLKSQKGLNGSNINSDLYTLSAVRPIVSNQGKIFRWQKAVQLYERGGKDLLSIALLGDSKTSDQDTWHRPLYEMITGAGLSARSYGYVSFSFREGAPWPTNKTRSLQSTEISQSGGDTLLGPDMNAVIMPQGNSVTFYTQGTPIGTGEYPWDSLKVYAWQETGGGTLRIRDSRGNQYGDFSTDGAEGLLEINLAIRNGQDISPRVIIESLTGSCYVFGIEQWNTQVERGFVLNKYGGSGSNFTSFVNSDDRTALEVIKRSSPDFIAVAHGINHSLAFINDFRTNSVRTYNQLSTEIPNASFSFTSTTYGGDADGRSDLYSNYLDSLTALSVIDAALINLNTAYYDSKAENVAKGVTPDGTHYEDAVGPTNAQFLFNLLFPTYSSNAGSSNSGPSVEQFWTSDGTKLSYTALPINVAGFSNTELLSGETFSEQAARRTFESRGQSLFGDSNSSYPSAKLIVSSNIDGIPQAVTGRGVLERATIAMVEDNDSWADGDLGPTLGFYTTANRKYGYIGAYRDGSNANFAGLEFGVHSSSSAGVDPIVAMRLTRTGRAQFPYLLTEAAVIPEGFVGYDAIGLIRKIDPSSFPGDDMGDNNAGGNQVTNAADATTPTALTTQQQVDAKIAAFIRSGQGSPEGALTAPPGTLYLNTLGGANTTLYVKETGTGNTGWVAK